MTIGELDRRVVIQYPQPGNNDYGEFVEGEWSDFRTVWAKIDWDGGNIKNQTDKITGITKVDFYIRNLDMSNWLQGTQTDAGPTLSWRIKYTQNTLDKYYYVHNIEEIEGRDAFLKITTEQKD
tara:strand:- start:222 stop:590 length:369 start_codon:yes stop_codon:yes gene_type:complete